MSMKKPFFQRNSHIFIGCTVIYCRDSFYRVIRERKKKKERKRQDPQKHKKMLFSFIRYWLYLCSSFLTYTFIFEKSKQTYYDPSSPHQTKYIRYIPNQMCALFHAAVTACYGWGYILGIFSEAMIWDARINSTAFLIFDVWKHWDVYNEKHRIDAHIQQRGLQHLDSKRAASLVAHHPVAVAFHHICTLIAMYGIFYGYDIAGAVLYFQSELPVVFINISRIFAYMGYADADMAMLSNWFSVVTYFVSRLVIFPIVFLIVLFPSTNIWNPFAWLFTACLGLIYIMNVISFNELLDQTHQQFPFTGKSLLSFLALVIARTFGITIPSSSLVQDSQRFQHAQSHTNRHHTSTIPST
ncbi:MAG: hypothetical protein Sylvanvirus2_21 [Sylvanvirus sp.]|uniref:Uncharacterized protein n=1 Tax=Sylvanvirus sp. TaxID=2487774 RepID=A0A3G5AH47_9VIRU|nr:MAG: hypothetical protein Sylvanvirus2_21 [Sylvanvirus sp.]